MARIYNPEKDRVLSKYIYSPNDPAKKNLIFGLNQRHNPTCLYSDEQLKTIIGFCFWGVDPFDPAFLRFIVTFPKSTNHTRVVIDMLPYDYPFFPDTNTGLTYRFSQQIIG